MITVAKPMIGKEEIALVNEVLASGMLAQGKKVQELEEKFAKLCGAKYAVAVNSGTAALHCCMYGLGIKHNDEVITTPFTFVATANSIIMQGAKPVFADVSEKDFNIDPGQIEAKITSKTKAIETVDLYGQLCDYKKILKIANSKNLKVIEDACQSVNAGSEGKKAGNLADAAAFSLYATKNIMCGEGGVLTTNSEEVMELAKRFRHHGQSEKTRYEYYDLGYNYRMMDLQAAIALAQLDRLQDITKKRIDNAKKLTKGLSKLKWIKLPAYKEDGSHVFHQYTIRVEASIRQKLVDFLKQKGIICGVYYPKPLHMHPFFTNKYGYKEGDFPVAEKLAKEVLSIPVHPLLSNEDIDTILSSFGEFDA